MWSQCPLPEQNSWEEDQVPARASRNQILNSKSRWSSAIELNLWPYVLQNANDIRNNLSDKEDSTSPVERYNQGQVTPKIRCHHTFGCPYYVLNNCLQAGGWQPKWEARASLGINLVTLPRHASSLAIILNLLTVLVSPQFLIQFDNLFETVRPPSVNSPTFSQW